MMGRAYEKACMKKHCLNNWINTCIIYLQALHMRGEKNHKQKTKLYPLHPMWNGGHLILATEHIVN